MAWLHIFMISLMAVLKTGHAVKCYQCATGYYKTAVPPFLTPTGGCWDKDFNSVKVRVIDCPHTCMGHGAAWTDVSATSMNMTIDTTDLVPVIGFPTTQEVTFGQSITRQCGTVSADYDFGHGKCRFSGHPVGLPTNGSLHSSTICCANDFCNGFPRGEEKPPTTTGPTTTKSTPASTTAKSGASILMQELTSVLGMFLIMFWTV